MTKCNTCGHATTTNKNSLYLDCGGDCLLCMSDSGDYHCAEHAAKIAGRLFRQLEIVKENLHRGMSRGQQRLQARSIDEVLCGYWD